MRTPLRLAASLARVQIAQAVSGKKVPPIYRLDIRFGAGELVVRSDFPARAQGSPASPQPAMQVDLVTRCPQNFDLPAAKSPVLWFTGPAELLDFSGTPGLARHYQKTRQTVFFETDGLLLRRRIHEFRPDERLYLTIRFYGMASTHDARMQREGAFEKAIEGIRAAQLSGFLICAHVIIEAGTELGEIERLLERLRTLHIDGVVVTAAEGFSEVTRNKLAVARELIGNAWWVKFSRLVQQAFFAAEPDPSALLGAAPAGLRTPAKLDLGHDTELSSEEAAI